MTNKQSVDEVVLQGKFGFMEKVDANRYTIEARKVILDTLEQGKVPIIEGGSWFYINHLFTGLTETFTNQNAIMDAKALASKLARDDGDFTRTFLKFKKLSEEVGFNDSIIGENDTFRLE